MFFLFDVAIYFFPKKLKIDPCFFPAGGEIFFFGAFALLPLLPLLMIGAAFFGGGGATSSSSEQLTSSIS